MSFETRVVPFLASVKGGKEGIGIAAKQLQELIATVVSEGWEFYSVETINVEVQPGCLAALQGKGPSYTPYEMVLFRRQR